MATLMHTEFLVDDEGGGQQNRKFTFDTVPQGDTYQVTVGWDGSGPGIVNLTMASPTAPIPTFPNTRVNATGNLTLTWDNAETQRLILFTGNLNTNHSTSVKGVCV